VGGSEHPAIHLDKVSVVLFQPITRDVVPRSNGHLQTAADTRLIKQMDLTVEFPEPPPYRAEADARALALAIAQAIKGTSSEIELS
jgi:hypothetical protein